MTQGDERISEEARVIDALVRLGIPYRDVHLTPGEGGSILTVFLPAQQPRPPGGSSASPRLSKCDQAILDLLQASKERLTASEIISAIGCGPVKYSASTIGHALARLRRRKLVDNLQGSPKSGYQLPS